MSMPRAQEQLEDVHRYEPGFESDVTEDASGQNSSLSGFFGPDSSSQLVELGVEDFPLYFSERDGRLFQSSLFSPYPLPVDTAEQQRLNVNHRLLHQLLGSVYVGPVREVVQGRGGLVLDLCTGTGKWVLEMASLFPNTFFRGVDIVPIATRYPPANVRFEMHDVNNQLRWQTSTVDIVHMRDAWMAIRDYQAMIQEVARVLRPGGLFISCEWDNSVSFHSTVVGVNAPYSNAFYNAVKEAFHICRGILPIAPYTPSFLTDSGFFESVTPETFYMPIGPWPPSEVAQSHCDMGRAYRAALRRYADSVKPLLHDAGWRQDEADSLVANFKQELVSVRGLVGVIHTVHARRRR